MIDMPDPFLALDPLRWTRCPCCEQVAKRELRCGSSLSVAQYAVCSGCGAIYHPSGRVLTRAEILAMRSKPYAGLIREEQEQVTERMIG